MYSSASEARYYFKIAKCSRSDFFGSMRNGVALRPAQGVIWCEVAPEKQILGHGDGRGQADQSLGAVLIAMGGALDSFGHKQLNRP